ncbi:PDR/VanB family oxidoreductase [Rhodococcus sp. NPDC055024]
MTTQKRSVRVVQARWEADGVLGLTLRAEDGAPLPSWTAGAHLDVVLPSGTIRQYSLCGPDDSSDYSIAVLREAAGRGGSAEIHDTALVGRVLQIAGPRNHFTLDDAARYIFVAGGIGITPVLAMVREASSRGAEWELHYGGRSRDSLAFTGELAALASSWRGKLRTYSDDVEGPLPLKHIVSGAADGAVIYACGPGGMLEALAELVEHERPDVPLRFERFSAAAVTPDEPSEASVTTGADAGTFEVELAQAGVTVMVSPGQTILEAVRAAVPDVMSSCEEGFCGTCEARVLDGVPVHRDSILSLREKEQNATMMICVSGCASPRLVLDL